ncbi:MAG: 4'-phosphopantetheinyl transferase superfamily protein [Sphingomonadales bacterium]|nr:4'-phosphopantetheinyl transferase superfamily protein [Sphingomonadales bacterium]MDE2171459.1 4'-phosphopantetheinyl transferase superfamily protein [Sphingomonadales bacterium]
METTIRTVTHALDFPGHAASWALDMAQARQVRLRPLHCLEAAGPGLPAREDLWLWLGMPAAAGRGQTGPQADAETLTRLNMADCLSDAELARAAQFRFEEDRWSYCAAHAGLRLLLGRILGEGPRQIRFATGAKGKPVLCASHTPPGLAERLHFNISHTRGLVAVALSGSPVGVDVERVRPLPDMRRLITSLMAPEALKAFAATRNVEDRLDLFFRYWTLGEAFIKATGEGLDQGLDSFAFTESGSPGLTRVTPGWGDIARWRFGHAHRPGVEKFSHAA